MGSGFRPAKQAEAKLDGKLSNDHHQEPIIVAEKRPPTFNSCLVQENNNRGRVLSRKDISQCLYMPIHHAAKELNVGIPLLKKRCRELGIRRWPHRKLASLCTLIDNIRIYNQPQTMLLCRNNNLKGPDSILSFEHWRLLLIVQELREGEDGWKVREAIKLLERKKRLMEEVPNLQLEDKTQRLRQACFKTKYKKRK